LLSEKSEFTAEYGEIAKKNLELVFLGALGDLCGEWSSR